MIIKTLRNIESQWTVLLIAILIYLILALVNINLFQDTLVFFWKALISIIPILIIVFVLLFLSNIFIKPKTIANYLGKNSKTKGWLIAIVGGIISSGPIYMWYPLLADLKEKGAKNALLVAFLYNRAVKIPLLPLMIYYFGGMFVGVLTFYMIIFSIVNGIIVEKLIKMGKEVEKV
jgi:uncharacterized membrane protein YraQ (UPF0718 family)